jgi:hypothetical protein
MTNVGMNRPSYTGLPFNQDNFNGIPAAAVPVSDQVKDTPAGSVASEFPTTPDEFVKYAPYAAAGLVGGFSIKKIIDILCNTDGKFNNSKLKQLAENIDSATGSIDKKIIEFLTKRKTGLNNLAQKSPDFIKKFYNDQLKNVVSSMDKGVEPISGMAKSQYHGLAGMQADHVVSEIKDLMEKGKLPKELNIPEITDAVKNHNGFGVNTLKEIESKLGKEEFEKLLLNNKSIKLERSIGIPLTKIKIPMGEKTVNLNASLNKYKGLSGEGAQTMLSKAVQKGTLITGEGLTGSVVGGSFGILLSAVFLASTLKKAVEAPKGEKLSTFMEEFWGSYFGFLVTMPLAEKILYKSLGARNIGTDKMIADALAKHKDFKQEGKILTANRNVSIKEGIEALVKKVKDDKQLDKLTTQELLDKKLTKLTKDEIKAIREEVKALVKLSNKETTLLQKPLKALGKLFGTGLGAETSTELLRKSSTLKEFGYKALHEVGGLGRFAIILFVLAPVLTKPFTWASHAIFGTPTATKKAEEEAKANKNKPKQEESKTVQADQTVPVATNTEKTSNKDNSKEDTATYIPSAEPAKFSANQSSAITNALKKSDSITTYLSDVQQSMH